LSFFSCLWSESESVIAGRGHVEPAGYHFLRFLADFLGTHDEHSVERAFADALAKFSFHEFIPRRKDHVALDSRHIGFRRQLFHLVCKFLTHQSEQGTDSVFKRAFSVICLAALAERDLKEPFLGRERFRTLLESGSTYLQDERELRGLTQGRAGYR
jgi:hypothetical protein